MMAPVNLALRCNAEGLEASLVEFGQLVGTGKALELDSDFPRHLRELLVEILVERRFDTQKLIRVDSQPSADGAGDVLLSFQPADLFLELLAALRARNCYVD
jgi:hypothetical protein